jgi:hypothetical protein
LLNFKLTKFALLGTYFIFYLVLSICAAPAKILAQDATSPLSQFSKEWNNPKYKVCNTGASAKYLSDKEKRDTLYPEFGQDGSSIILQNCSGACA